MIVRNLLLRLAFLLVALVVVALAFARTLTDWMWFGSLGRTALFVTPWTWRCAVFAGATLVALAVLWLNFSLARPALARAYLRWDELTSSRLAGAWRLLRRFASLAVLGLAVLLGLGVSSRWMEVGLFFHRRPFGVVDPVLGQDAGFYVFSLPFYRIVLSLVTGALVLSLGIILFVYTAAGLLAWRRGSGQALWGRPRRHVFLLLAALAAIWAVETWLGRFDLLFAPGGVIYGPTFTDVHVRLPLRVIVTALAGVTAVLTAAAAWRPWGRYAAGAAIVTLAVAVAGEAGAGLVQRFVVRPNELVREEPFLRHHIAMTRKAYGLDGVREVAFDPKDAIEATDVQAARPLLQEIRLWDWRPLGRAYSQLQEFRPYYDFVEVDVDRYRVGDRIRQVMLSVRELNAQRLQNPSWINRKLQYTHGYGLVMSPASEVSGQGMPRLTVADIPPRSQDGWPQVTRPQIYFGEMAADWIVVQGRTPEFDYPSGDQNVFNRYEGKDGIALTLWNRLLFAARFGSTELLLSPEVSAKSRVLMYRTVMERLQRLMPFLRYDRDPYPIVTRDGHVLWMVDAYTTTDRFPYARPMAGWGNYARNSVKVTLDAYDGTVHFYQVDESEPLASALSDLFGGFLEPASAVPEDVRAHWRYPEDLFWLQAAVYAVYHMVNPGLFYNQEDRWDFPREIHGEQEVVMQPYYAIVDLGDGPEFALLYPFTAQDKQNMTAWMVGRSDPPHYGQLQVFRFPKQRLTYGPMQIEARINQDPDISRELTLWGQRGSRVLRGNLIVVPVRGTVLYVKPLFLVSEQSQLPELRRVVLATSAQLVMAPDLMSALAIATGAQAPAPPATPAALPPAASPTGPQAAQNARLREALDALQQARRRLEAGDWEGFGKAMQQVEALLKEVAGGT